MDFQKCRFLSTHAYPDTEEPKMSIRWKFNYGLVAVIAAIMVIAVALVANPIITDPAPDQIFNASSFLVMLTDPPTVPDGTTLLNLTYTDFSLHVTYPNETAAWIPVDASGTVNLLSLVNMSQTLAATTIPTGSAVDKIQFTIADVKAVVNGETYNVTALSNSIVMTISNSAVNQTLSGVLVDFNPTLVQIQGDDAEGNEIDYYVLVPSATARIINNLRQEQSKVGTIVDLEERHRAELEDSADEFSRNVTISSASVTVNGNITTFSVTIENHGNSTFRAFGLTLHGEFNTTRILDRTTGRHGQNRGNGAGNGADDANVKIIVEQIHPRTIPFKVDETALIPLFGTNQEHDDEYNRISSLILDPEETVTLTFSGIISLQPGRANMEKPITVITPTAGSNYTIRLMGEGFRTFNVTTPP